MSKLITLVFLLSSFVFAQQIEDVKEFKSDRSSYINIISHPNTSDFIPTINAESDVSVSGAFSQIIPIEVLGGINNFQPNISLVYNSQTHGGLAGEGWNISGLSSITLGGKSLQIDNNSEGITFDGTDPYYLDGQRLIESNGEYYTEALSAIKIRKNDATTFTVHFTDGRVSTYRKIGLFDFVITEMRDAFNNKITYEYENNGNISYIKKISYGLNALFSLEFDYTENPNRIISYVNGSEIISNKVLSQITINSREGLFRKYSLTHDLTSLKYPRLREVNVFNNKNEVLKPLKFDYNSEDSSRKLIKHVEHINRFSKNTLTLGSTTQGDFEGNGNLSSIYVVNEYDKYNPKPNKTKEFFSSIVHEKMGPIVSDLKFDSNLNLHAGKIIDYEGKLTKNDYLLFLDRNVYNKETLRFNNNHIINTTYQIKAIDPLTSKEYSKSVVIPAGINVDRDMRIIRLADDFFELSGDFNNDGLIDLLIFRKPSFAFPSSYEASILLKIEAEIKLSMLVSFNKIEVEKYPSALYFYELGKEIRNPGSVELIQLASDIAFEEGKVYPINFDRDGMTDFLFVDEKKQEFNVKSVKKNLNGSHSLITKLEAQHLAYFQEGSPLVFGDFNGDGLTDFMTPTKLYDISNSNIQRVANEIINDKKIWWEYINTGKGQFKAKERDFSINGLISCKSSQRAVTKKSSNWQKFWSGKPDKYLYSEYASCGVIATDFNNDGRSDLIAFNYFGTITPGKTDPSLIQNNIIKSYEESEGLTNIFLNKISFIENKPSNSGDYDLYLDSNTLYLNNTISPFTLIGSNNSEKKLETFNIGVHFIDPFNSIKINYDIQTHNFLETKISKIDNGTGIIQSIEYTPMSESSVSPIAILDSNKVLENKNIYYSIDQNISDDLKYPYYVNRKQPGFYLVNRVNTIFDNKSISKEYRYTNAIQNLNGKGFLGFQRVATSNTYESILKDGQHLPKELGADVLWSTSLYDPLQENQLIEKTIGNLNGDHYTTKSSIEYKKLINNKAYIYLKEKEKAEDRLRDFTILKSYTYNSDGLMIASSIDYNTENNLKTLETFEYEPIFFNEQKLFFGKIKKHENTSIDNIGSFTSKNIYTYYKTNGSVSKNEKYGHNTSAIISEFKYDDVGNRIEETLSGEGINTLTTKLEYDATKRFVVKTISPEGLITSASIDFYGKPLITTNNLGLKTSYKYDHWGNNIESIDPFNIKTTLIKKMLDNDRYSLSTFTLGVPSTIVIYDKFERIIQKKTQSINNKWSIVDFEYDLFGKLIKESEPYFELEPKKWNVTEYDALDRIVKHTQSNGKVVSTCYENLSITVDEGHKKTSKFYNSAGQIIKHTDKGGSVFYTYYPNGVLKTANYDGNIISILQDGWGNKIELRDPSAGTYNYKYNALGNIEEEVSPNGKTLYIYDRFNRLVKENIYSNDNTIIDINYEFNPITLLPTKTYGTSNDQYYEYEILYDELFRLKGKKETTKDFIYESFLTYDAENKVKETSSKTTLKSINKVITSKVHNVYDTNGFLIEERDAIKNRIIKRISEVNAQGQVKKLNLGNNLSIMTSYDKDFNPSQIDLTNNIGNSQLRIDYTFNSKRNILEKRNIQFEGLTPSNESFIYDELDRLTVEKENEVPISKYVYDQKGRMVYNSEVGKLNYKDINYQIKQIFFNKKGDQLVKERGLHEIKFNSYKQATEIYLEGKDRISYDFNLLKERSIAYYGNLDVDKNIRPYRKFYTSDKAVEILFDGVNYKIITYIDGDPYSSSYIQINEILANNTQTETNYFLHRDIQGTILALSSVSGDLEEKRLYDAWGNIKLVVHKDGSINKLLGIIDRGYTGHEHLQSIGLIHMNGRLYDPILRRFISPDNFVQDPYNTQNFDRYAYVYNNPLSYTDPDGEFIVGVLVGVAVGVTTNAIMNAIQGIPLWYGMGKAITISAISAGVSFGIGSIATEIGNTSFRVAFQAGAHATSGGIFSSIDGGNFLSGFTSGAISSLAGSGIDGLKIESDSFSDALIIASGGLTGGISSTIAGGSFWKGIRQGLITTGLNHVQHKFVNSFLDNGYEKDGKGGYRRVNNKGGDDTDYLYEKGRIIQSKEVSASPHELTQRTYGIKAGSPNLIEVDIIGTLLGGKAVLMGFYQLGKVGLVIFKTPIAAKTGVNTVVRSESTLGHIFRNAPGHVNPSTVTSQSRYINLFEKVANNSANLNPNVLTNYQRTTGGFQGFSQTFRNGSQIWTQTLNGKIINAGVNTIPK